MKRRNEKLLFATKIRGRTGRGYPVLPANR
jgi:hypothetical protein